jgi:CHAP domain
VLQKRGGRPIKWQMSLADTLARIKQLEAVLDPQPAATPAPAAASGTAAAFASVLQSQGASASARVGPIAGVGVAGLSAGPGGGAAGVVAAAQAEVGQAEMPPGSNDSPRIATYRAATAGSGVGPWCGYFVSWCARQAGEPLGEVGQGFGSVDALYAWAQRAGRAVPNGAGVTPQPGDLIVWNEHVGVVESVDPDGTIHTIEGNSGDAVSRRAYAPGGGGAVGYVRM